MPARDEILNALRAAAPAEVSLPDMRGLNAVRYPDLRERFARSIAEVGGRCVLAGGLLEEELARLPEYAAARMVVSLVPGVAKANLDLAAIGDPHELRDVDFCVLGAELGVAENGAVWITEHGGKNRAVAFLTQHLAVVVRADTLVHNLHEAYEKVAIPSPGFMNSAVKARAAAIQSSTARKWVNWWRNPRINE